MESSTPADQPDKRESFPAPPPEREKATKQVVGIGAMPLGFYVMTILILLAALWGSAESHDQNCYEKTLLQAASGNTEESNCLILPWNDPAEGNNPGPFQ